MKCVALVTVIIGLFCAAIVRAESPDGEYIRVYNLILQADGLYQDGQTKTALDRYQEAEAGLTKLMVTYPGWNDKLIEFRLNYVKDKLAQFGPLDKPAKPEPSAPNPTVELEPGKRNGPSTGEPAKRPEDRLPALQEEIQRLTADKAKLEAKLREALSAQPAPSDNAELAQAQQKIRVLQTENAELKTSLLQLQTKTAKTTKTERPAADKSEAATVSKAESKRVKQLEEERDDLAKKLAEAKTTKTTKTERPAADKSEAATVSKAESKRVKQLEEERDDLAKKLAEAKKSLARQRGPDKNSALAELGQELTITKARLEALEAKKVPFSAEELALIKTRPATNSTADVTPRKVTRTLPPGTGPLVAEADRAFAAKNYAEAEQKYLQVLKQDDKNVIALGNLASVNIEQNRLDEAEANLKKALEVDPDDAFNLSLMGKLRIWQEKYDAAFDVLSHAVQQDPQNAMAHMYLGIALSEKGQREAAEAALRKAIQLAPNSGDAHYNLAFIYAMQKPPFLELARYHYQKSLTNGHVRKPEFEKVLGL